MNREDCILMVDEDRLFLTGMRNELLLRGFKHIQTADSVREALQKAKCTKFNVVLIDLFMSQPAGLEVAEQIEKYNHETQIILLLKEEFQPLFTGEFRFQISLKRDLLPFLLQDG